MIEGMHTFGGVPKVCRPPPANQGMAPEGMQAPPAYLQARARRYAGVALPRAGVRGSSRGCAAAAAAARPPRLQILVPRLGESPNRTKKCGPQPNFVKKL